MEITNNFNKVKGNPSIPYDKVVKLVSDMKEKTTNEIFPMEIKCPCCKNRFSILNRDLEINVKDVFFTNEEINELKDIKDEKDIDLDITEFERLRSLINVDSLALSELFIKCYDYINQNCYVFNDYSKKLKKYLSSMDVSYLRVNLEEYNSGISFGKTDILNNIRDYNNENRSKMIELLGIFFKVFGDEDNES